MKSTLVSSAPQGQFDKSRFCVLYKRVRDGVVVATQNASEWITSRIQQKKDELRRGKEAPPLIINDLVCTNMEPLVAKPMSFEGQGEVDDEVDDGQPLVAPKMNFEKK